LRLESLGLNDNELTVIPEYLYIGRSVTKIPESIGTLKNLRQMDSWDSNIKTLLKELEINTALQPIPDWLGGLTSLTKLIITSYTITDLPDSISLETT